MRRHMLSDIVRGVLLEGERITPADVARGAEYERFSDDPYTDVAIKLAIIYGLPILTKYLIGALATIGAISVISAMQNASADRNFALSEYMRRKQSEAGGKITISFKNDSDSTVRITKVYGGYLVMGSAAGKPPPAPGEKTGAVETQGIMGNTMISAFRVLFNDKPHKDAIEIDVPSVEVPPKLTVDVTVNHPGEVEIDGPFVAVHALATMGEAGHEASTYLPIGFIGRTKPEHVAVVTQDVAAELSREADKVMSRDVKKARKDVRNPYLPVPSPVAREAQTPESQAKYEEAMDFMDKGAFMDAVLSFGESEAAGGGVPAALMGIRARIRLAGEFSSKADADIYYRHTLVTLEGIERSRMTREQRAEATMLEREILRKLGKI